MDGRTDGQTDKPCFRDASAHLKRRKIEEARRIKKEKERNEKKIECEE